MTEDLETQMPIIHDLVIVGAGPCGLAVAARMRENTPSALFADFEHQRYHWLAKHAKRQRKLSTKGRGRNMVVVEGSGEDRDLKGREGDHHLHASDYSIQVFDSTGSTWMAKWKSLFSAFDIKMLRSPLFFHPGPEDRDGLKAFAYAKGREAELCELKGVCGKEISKHEKKKAMKRRTAKDAPRGKSIDERDKQDYFTPSTNLFDDYCTDCVDRYRLDKLVDQADVKSIHFDKLAKEDRPEDCFTVETSHGISYARAVVLAIGPGVPNSIPISATETEGACHSSRLTAMGPLAPHVQQKVMDQRAVNVVVVGGGLTSAQIGDMALKKGVTTVYHVMRGDYKLKHFDLGLPWVAKYKNFELATFFGLESDQERADMILAARNGGSITPAYDKILAKHIEKKRMVRLTKTIIVDKKWNPTTKQWSLTTNSATTDLPPIDYIYFATGAKADILSLPVMQRMLSEYPIETINGLPCLTDELQWNKDVPFFVAGRFASLRLGPGAANLEGARTGAERIVCRVQEILEKREDKGDAGMVEEPLGRLEEIKRQYDFGGSHLNMYSALDC